VGIIELLERVGEGNARVQFLAEWITNISTNRQNTETKITFVTDPDCITATDVGRNDVKHIGVVVWLPAAAARKAERDSMAAGAAHA
jgi:hypothetical protein